MNQYVVQIGLMVGFIFLVMPRFIAAQDEGYYIYSLAADSSSEIPGRQDFTTSMSFSDTVTAADVSVTFGFQVAEPSEKIILDVGEEIVVDFTAKLEQDDSGVQHGYILIVDGFEIVSSEGEQGDFPSVGSSFSGNAVLRYTGTANGDGKHWFKLAVTGPIVSNAEFSEMWCSEMAPNPVIQTVPDCSGACALPSSFGGPCNNSLSKSLAALYPRSARRWSHNWHPLHPAPIEIQAFLMKITISSFSE